MAVHKMNDPHISQALSVQFPTALPVGLASDKLQHTSFKVRAPFKLLDSSPEPGSKSLRSLNTEPKAL